MKDFNPELKKLNKIFSDAITLAMSNDEVMNRHKEEIKTIFSDNGFKIFGTPAVYFGNYGRRPGRMPPKGKLLDWMSRHDIAVGAEFPIRRKIGREGTEGRHFLPDLKKETDAANKMILDSIYKTIKTTLNLT